MEFLIHHWSFNFIRGKNPKKKSFLFSQKVIFTRKVQIRFSVSEYEKKFIDSLKKAFGDILSGYFPIYGRNQEETDPTGEYCWSIIDIPTCGHDFFILSETFLSARSVEYWMGLHDGFSSKVISKYFGLLEMAFCVEKEKKNLIDYLRTNVSCSTKRSSKITWIIYRYLSLFAADWHQSLSMIATQLYNLRRYRKWNFSDLH